MKTEHPKIVRVIVEKRGLCIINSPLNPSASREEIESQKWCPSGVQSFQYDECGVVIVCTL